MKQRVGQKNRHIFPHCEFTSRRLSKLRLRYNIKPFKGNGVSKFVGFIYVSV
jgi:hypothetical protein